MILVGVTGGIGAGKTTLLTCLQELGAHTADADAEVHRLYRPGEAVHRALCERWGRSVLLPNGDLDRQAVAARVFRDAGEREWLNRLVHPLVQERLVEQAVCLGDEPLFCAVPLLYEVGWQDRFVQVVAVWCDRATQARRLAQRGWDQAEIDRRQACQMSMDEKLLRADQGIINTGPMSVLRQQCARCLNHVIASLKPGSNASQ